MLILFPIIYHSSYAKRHKNIPPSPWKLPIIGNIHQLGTSYHRSLWQLAKKHGPVMLLHLGSTPVLIASSVYATREIMKTHEFAFLDRGEVGILKKLTYNGKDLALADYGESWRQLKSLVVVHLLSNKRVQSFQRVRDEEIALMMDTIRETCGTVVDFTELFLSVVNGVLCRVTFGTKYRDESFLGMVEEFKKLVVILSAGQYIPWLTWFDRLRGLNVRTEKVAKNFDDFLEGVIEERLRRNKDESTFVDYNMFEQEKYFIDILLEQQKEGVNNFQIDRDTIKGVILDMFAGAADTSFTALEWALSELIRNPRVMKKLQQEVDSIGQSKPEISEEDAGKLYYLKAVIKETMRLHAPASLVIRASLQDVKVMGYDIEAKTRVFINLYALGQDPAVWDEPEKFIPERFMDCPIDYKGNNYEYMRFKGGRRGCPGIHFANTLMEVVLANVIYKFDLVLPNGERGEDLEMSEGNALTVHRKNHLLLVASPRAF
ncbi:cytochrome P450 Tp4149-like [Rutidosis leptorrhynchoides]|uniref:cytochrome P450 Tp4149-like n=1 Tax=Rutidosis leptorrhynchoides TaxID=125765 RepID=UPI003A99D0F0